MYEIPVGMYSSFSQIAHHFLKMVKHHKLLKYQSCLKTPELSLIQTYFLYFYYISNTRFIYLG